MQFPPTRDLWSRSRPVGPGGLLAALLAAVVVALSGAPALAQEPYTQIEWGTGLSEKAIQYRNDHNLSSGRNVAVFEFKRPDGKYGTIAIDSERYTPKETRGDRIEGHSERRAADILRSYGIKPEWVTRIYSELHPCRLRGRYCDNLLRTTFKEAKVSYSFEYGDSKESRGRGTAALKETVDDYNARRDAARDIGRVPGTKAPTGALTDGLARGVRGPGGIDFSSLELRYVSDAGAKGKGIGFAMRGRPGDGPGDPALGLQTARRASDAFFAWLTLPRQSFWVNLKPNEPDRIIDPQFARTDAGHVLLDADLRLKRLVGPLTNPANPTGAEFWRQIDALYGGDGMKSNACYSFRQWITPAPATVRETGSELYVLDAPLKVQMEAADLGSGTIADGCPQEDPALLAAKGEVYRRVILPQVEHAVNTAPEFAELRRVYVSRVAAEWVRARSDRKSPLGRLVDSGRIGRWVAQPPWNPFDIFNAYLRSVREGEYSYQRQFERDGTTYTLTYVTGGVDFSATPRDNVSRRDFKARWPRLAARARRSIRRATADAERGEVWLGAGRAGKAQPRIRNHASSRPRGRALRLRMTAAQGSVRSGGLVRFRLRVRNGGGSRVARLDVCDRLPPELVYVRSSRPRRVSAGRHCWRIRGLAAGRSAEIRLTARVAGGARGSVRNVATVSVPGAPALRARTSRTLRVRGASGAPPGGVAG
jgi:hypothetical protein